MVDVSYNELPDLYEAPLGEIGSKYLFISYSHEDMGIVYQDLKALSANGARVWYDRAMHIGQNWVDRAKNKIFDRNCGGVVFYISENSLLSSAFLQELEFSLQRHEEDKSFIYISVNIGEKTVFEILKTVEVDESVFLKEVIAFNANKLYIPRKSNPFDTTHIVKLIDVFKESEAIDTSKCIIDQSRLFDYAEYEQGLQITKYRGTDSVVNLSAMYNGKKIIAIGINCFKNNLAIRKVNVPEGIRIIDDFAFSGCINIESVVLPNSMVSLGYEAFRECNALREIVIPYNVSRIGDHCFYRCHHLKSIVMLSVVPLSIDFAAFEECHAADKIVLPDSTKVIGPYAFNNCINITTFIIPENVKHIGLSGFYNCASLKNVVIKTRKPLEYNNFFARCRNLKSIQVEASQMQQYLDDPSWKAYESMLVFKLSTPSNIAFENGILSWNSVDASDYYFVSVNNEKYQTTRPLFVVPKNDGIDKQSVSITAHSYDERILDSDASAEMEIASSRDTYEIVTDSENVILVKYYGNTPIVEIPREVTQIGESAFYNHEEIREIKFSDSLIKIGDKAFYHCLGIQKLEFPKSLIEIGDDAFWGASIRELTIPRNVAYIGNSCFACCNFLEKLDILSSQMIAGKKAFYRCISLRKVTFPKDFQELYTGMFRGCTELDELSLPVGLKAIRSRSISYIMRLQRIVIPCSVEMIEDDAFSNSFGLKEIFVDERNAYYFDLCGILFSKRKKCLVYFPADKELNKFIVDDDVSEISDFAFMDAEHLEKIIIGSGTHLIGQSAFERCPNLCEIIINGEIEMIRKNAFKDCINLKRLFLMSGMVPEIEAGVFDNVSSRFKIIVPEKYIKNYLRIADWKDYQYLIQPLETDENKNTLSRNN